MGALQITKPLERANQRVLTTAQLAEYYEASAQNLNDNLSNNRDKFIEGKHYFKLEGEGLAKFKEQASLKASGMLKPLATLPLDREGRGASCEDADYREGVGGV